MAKAHCIRVTPEEVHSFAQALNISDIKAHANIMLWAGEKEMDRLPTVDELREFIKTVDYKSQKYLETENYIRREHFFMNTFGGEFEGGSFFSEYHGLNGDDLGNKEAQMELLDAVDDIQNAYFANEPLPDESLQKVLAYMRRVNPTAYNQAREDYKKRFPDAWNEARPQQQSAQAQQPQTETTIEYTPIGKERQTYTIRGSHIYNKEGKEVFKEDSRDRNKIFANLAVKQGRAVAVEYRGSAYIVNDRGDIMSTSKTNSGAIMKWGPENGDRNAILKLASDKGLKISSTQSSSQQQEEQPILGLPQKKKTVSRRGGEIVLTDEQQVAVDKVTKFIEEQADSGRNSTGKRYITISGQAGTGKTTIIESIVKQLHKDGMYVPIAGAAVSRKAVHVLTDKLKKYGVEKETIYSLCGASPKKSEDEFAIDPKKQKFTKYGLIFIDEASMISKKMLSVIDGYMTQNPHVVVVFLGDYGQVRPINQKPVLEKASISVTGESNIQVDQNFTGKSPVFDRDKCEIVSLTERIRQGEDSPILSYADKFYEISVGKSDAPISTIDSSQRVTELNDAGGIIFNRYAAPRTLSKIIEVFRRAVSSGATTLAKVVTSTNNTRDAINLSIHNALFPNSLNEMTEGDMVIFDAPYEVSQGISIDNSEEGVVLKDYGQGDESGIKYHSYQVRISDGGVYLIKVLDKNVPGNEANYKRKCEELRAAAIALDSSPNRIERAKAWRAYYSFRDYFADMTFGYAMTAHKSQGSTYDMVFVDEAGIRANGKEWGNQERAELIYTALTRGRNLAIVMSDVDSGEEVPSYLALNDKIEENKKQDSVEEPAVENPVEDRGPDDIDEAAIGFGARLSEEAQQSTPQPAIPKPEQTTLPVRTVEKSDIAALNATYPNPTTKKFRVQEIAIRFSDLLNEKYNNRLEELKKQRKEAEDSGNKDLASTLYAKEIGLTKAKFLEELGGVRGLFEEIYNQYDPESVTEEAERQLFLENFGEQSKWSEEDYANRAKRDAEYKRIEYQKVRDNFWALAEEATLEIRKRDRIIIDVSSASARVDSEQSGYKNEDNEGSVNPTNNVQDMETQNSESWMNSFRTISAISSLSETTRRVLDRLYETDKKGYVEFTDLGEDRFIDAEYAHAVLLYGLADMIDSRDFLPSLLKLGQKYTFVRQLYKQNKDGTFDGILAKNPQILAAFYQDFRKDITSYWASRGNRDFVTKEFVGDKTFPLNSRENIGYLLTSWQHNTEGGLMIAGQESLFNSNGTLDKDACRRAGAKVAALANRLDSFNKEGLTTAERNRRIEEVLNSDITVTYKDDSGKETKETKNGWGILVELLHSIGVDQDEEDLKWVLVDSKSQHDEPITVRKVLDSIQTIVGKINKTSSYFTKDKEGNLPVVNMLDVFKSAYTDIAHEVSFLTQGEAESSFHHMDKTRYSHTTPNYLGKVMKELQGVQGEERFNEYIEKQFVPYKWFREEVNGESVWMNPWIEELISNPELRKSFRHKVVLDFNKKGFFEADSREYALGLLREFNAGMSAKTKAGEFQMAWYYVPMLSDTDSSEFIQFIKDTDDGYQDRLISKMRLTVFQEWNRIKLVKRRAKSIANGEAHPIANFDTVGDKKGRGEEFCFFPQLNTWKDENGKTFIEWLNEYDTQSSDAKNNDDKGTLDAVNSERAAFIDRVLKEIIEQDVEDTYNRYCDLGVFDKTVAGKYKYLKGVKDFDRNSVIEQGRSFIAKALEVAKTNPEKYPKFIKVAERYLENPLSISVRVRENLFEVARQFNTDDYSGYDPHREMVSQMVYNSRLATSQIVQIFATDYAYYKDAVDFQKRFKEIHAPSLRLYTDAEFNEKRIGRKEERSLYLADEKIISNTFDDLKDAIEARVSLDKNDERHLSRASADFILRQYEKINASDAQAYRCLSSYRAILGMSGQWTDALEEAYKRLKSGKWNIEDFSTILQTKKPYLYTQTGIDTEVGTGEKMKVGVQHKNSEFLLLAMIPIILGEKKGSMSMQSQKLIALNEFMEKGYMNDDGSVGTGGIDVVNFTSAVKVGNQGVIDFTYDSRKIDYDWKKKLDKRFAKGEITKAGYDSEIAPYLLSNMTAKDVLQYLEDMTSSSDGGESPFVIHTLDYEDYGIQTQTPEHIIDHEQLFGTQIRRLIGADITPGTILEVGGIKMSAEQWWKTYNGLLVDNIVQSYGEVSDKFSTPEKLYQTLADVIKSSDRYPKDLLNAIRLVDDIGLNGKPTGRKRFNIPLFDSGIADVVESLINSVIKDTVTKQKIKGGSCIQVSSFGFSDKLKVVYEGEGANKRVKYMECFMPAYAKDFYSGLMEMDEKGNYFLDINKLSDDLRRAIGYRVPTEDKYSMAPLYIKGFLPQQNGSAIMLPAEITTLSGSDFDVDKMYIMLPEFDIIKYDKKQALQDYKKFNSKYAQTQSWLDSIFDIIVNESDQDIEDENGDEITEAHSDFRRWWKENKENYKLDKPKYVRVNGKFNEDGTFNDGLAGKDNPSKSDMKRARQKRNNAIIDMMWSVLTNADTLARYVKPGGYVEVKKQSYIQRILSNISYDSLEKALKSDKEIKFKNSVSETLNSLDEDSLAKLASKYGKTLDPLSVTTQLHFHKQNSAGSKAIGIYAVSNAGQALLQHSTLSLEGNGENSKTSPVSLFGKTKASLHDIKNDRGQYITNNEAQYLAAAVDNGKDPTLEDNGQNDFTYNMSNLLVRLGFTHAEVAAVMNQPIIKEMAEAVTKQMADGISRDEAINGILKKYADKAGVKYTSDYFVGERINGITLEDMYKMRCKDAESDPKFFLYQYVIGSWFRENADNAQFLTNSTQNLRGDAQNGAAGPGVMDTIVRQIRIENSIKAKYGLYDSSEDMSVEAIKEHPLGFIIAFQQFGIKGTTDILREYFPQYSGDFMSALADLINRTKNRSVSVDLAQKFFDAAIIYRLSALPVLNQIYTEKEGWKAATREEVVNHFYYDFPKMFKEYKESNPVIYEANGTEIHFNDIPIIQVLKYAIANRNNPIDSIVMDNAGKLTKEGKQRLTQSWESLIFSGDSKAITLAINLFTYGLLRYGGKFSPSGFAHLTPMAVKESVEGYVDALETVRKMGTNVFGNDDFKIMFMRNNTHERTLFPKMSENESKVILDKLLTEDNKIGNKTYSFTLKEASDAAEYPSLMTARDTEKGVMATFNNGFCIVSQNEKGESEPHYYVMMPESGSNSSVVIYEVEPLGIKEKMNEYFFNNDNPMSKTLIKENEEYAKENPRDDTPEEPNSPEYDITEDMYEITSRTDDEGNVICGIKLK